MTESRTPRRRLAALAAAGLLAAGALALALRGPQAGGTPPGDAAAAPQAAPVQHRALARTLDLAGTLQPAQVLDVVAPFDAVVLQRPFAWGEPLVQDALLLELSTDDIDQQLRDAEAALRKAAQAAEDAGQWAQGVDVQRALRAVGQAQRQAADAARRLAETQRLFDLGIVPRNELDEQRAQQFQLEQQLAGAQDELQATRRRGGESARRIAELELQSAQARLRQLQADRERRRLRMPAAGTVAPGPARNGEAAGGVSVGTRVRRGEVLLRVQSHDRFVLSAPAEETQVMELAPGQRAEVTLAALPGLALQGRVLSVASLPMADSGRGGEPPRFEVRIALDDAQALDGARAARLRPGLSAQALVTLQERPQALVVPPAAVQRDDGGHFVMARRAGSGGAWQRVAVQPGLLDAMGLEVAGALGPDSEVRLPSPPPLADPATAAPPAPPPGGPMQPPAPGALTPGAGGLPPGTAGLAPVGGPAHGAPPGGSAQPASTR